MSSLITSFGLRLLSVVCLTNGRVVLLAGIVAGVGLMAATPAMAAAKRTFDVMAPTSAAPGYEVTILIAASADAGSREQIGFLQAEYSVDNGKTWTVICYDTAVGDMTTREVHVRVGGAGSSTLVRARAAFRSPAGDVDCNGKPIDWDGSWAKWKTPPAKLATIAVRAK